MFVQFHVIWFYFVLFNFILFEFISFYSISCCILSLLVFILVRTSSAHSVYDHIFRSFFVFGSISHYFMLAFPLDLPFLFNILATGAVDREFFANF